MKILNPKFLLKSEFNRNALTLMTGTMIAQAIPVGISPILTRIYSPEEFGLLAIFFALSNIFGNIANLKYELAIMLPKKDEDAINILALGFVINMAISFALLVLAVYFNGLFTSLLSNQQIGPWLYFVPIYVFLFGIFNLLNYFNIRKKYYKDISTANVIKSLSGAIVQLSLGFLKVGAGGLITGALATNFFGNIKLLRNIVRNKILIKSINRTKIKALAKRYKDFPLYMTWATLANTMSRDLTNILISSFYSVTTLGYYSFVQRIVGMPSLLFGTSIGQVFFEEATKEKNETGSAVKTFISTLKKLIIISVPTFTILFFIVEDVFAFVFGEEWRIAGTYSKILIPMFAFRFIGSPLSMVLTIFEKQNIILVLGLLDILLVVGSISIIYYFDYDFFTFLYAISILSCVVFLIYIYIYFVQCRKKLLN